eukprot:3329576-Ditylum_brightwellii.AAC.1
MAQLDLIRDVTDVISWIQYLLSSSSVDDTTTTTTTNKNNLYQVQNDLVVYYALQSLHYFIVAQELDFRTVLQVIRNKLVQWQNVEDLIRLDDLVLEALVILLGDGHIISQEKDADMVLPSHIMNAVNVLIELGLFLTSEEEEEDAKLSSKSQQ